MTVREIVKQILNCFDDGGKLLIVGNGGSAAEAQHFSGELINEGLPCIALTTDTSVLTALANDYSFDEVFSRQITALGREGDILLTLSTSGTSKNILKSILKAHKNGMIHIALPTNKDLGKNTQQTQEIHLKMLHQIWGYIRENRKI